MNRPTLIRCFQTAIIAGWVTFSAVSCTYPYAGPNQQVGTVIGAGTGALAGALIGNQSGRALEGAAIGTALGAVAGAAVGSTQDQYMYTQPQPFYATRPLAYYTPPPPVIVQRRFISPGFGYGGGWGNACSPWGGGFGVSRGFGNCYNPCW